MKSDWSFTKKAPKLLRLLLHEVLVLISNFPSNNVKQYIIKLNFKKTQPDEIGKKHENSPCCFSQIFALKTQLAASKQV